MRALASATGVALAGCAYHAGSLATTEPGQPITIGCLDLAIDRRPDLPDGTTVVAYAFGNRCDGPALVDLASVVVVGRTGDGRAIALVPHDPRDQIEALYVDGRATGREAIAYVGQEGEPMQEVCIDAASITRSAPAAWVCFPSLLQLAGAP
jgi:hypothetical protein